MKKLQIVKLILGDGKSIFNQLQYGTGFRDFQFKFKIARAKQ